MAVTSEDLPGMPSTGAVPMDPPAGELTVPGIPADGAPGTIANVVFPTPGPVSYGHPETVAKQRASLNLSGDPSGDSDRDWDPESVAPTAPTVPDPKDTTGAVPQVDPEPVPLEAAAAQLVDANGAPVAVPVAAPGTPPEPIAPAPDGTPAPALVADPAAPNVTAVVVDPPAAPPASAVVGDPAVVAPPVQ